MDNTALMTFIYKQAQHLRYRESNENSLNLSQKTNFKAILSHLTRGFFNAYLKKNNLILFSLFSTLCVAKRKCVHQFF